MIPNLNMEPALSSAQHQNLKKVVANGKKLKRSKNSRGVRKVGTRIYDSANGKTCHQLTLWSLSLDDIGGL
ncbi:hypothetical protein CR513_44864, partial [Mucuna pruriens]